MENLTEINIYLSIIAVFSYLVDKYQIGINNPWWVKALVSLPYVLVVPFWIVWIMLQSSQYM